jgi:hypothetical protein
MGLTRLCDLDTELSPQKWADLILESYRHHGDGTLPDYIQVPILPKVTRIGLHIPIYNNKYL